MSQLVAKRSAKLKSTGRHAANIMKEAIAEFNQKWDDVVVKPDTWYGIYIRV